ncbi:hypothetical protein B0H16DRAFT_1523788 [Mycena metata]|uniref:G domain-containing protein n=1 Tax=Mycena metata TaxID=1033252 RepID=A0AAD7NLL0_9AGAR|nr:hypothetical protein B0H16DRAFT_1523788 [Mycena metata]
MTSHTETPSTDDLSFWTSRKLEFRVLILGRANAGKTTILERVAGAAISETEVRQDGKLLHTQMIKGQSNRGFHNVDNEIRFPSRPGFVFHDSQGVEAGSAEELSTVQKFVTNRSSATHLGLQLHAIWMCVPLDESRELFEGEKAPFRWSKGATPLVVIFTKRDGAVVKEMSDIIDQLMKDSPEVTVGRSVKKEARGKADVKVTNRVNELQGELRALSLADDAVAFLTTSGMEERTADTDKTCEKLIELTEDCLTGPRIKTLLSAVWGRNLLTRGFWMIYWTLKGNHEAVIQLGSRTPGTREMIAVIVRNMMVSNFSVHVVPLPNGFRRCLHSLM